MALRGTLQPDPPRRSPKASHSKWDHGALSSHRLPLGSSAGAATHRCGAWVGERRSATAGGPGWFDRASPSAVSPAGTRIHSKLPAEAHFLFLRRRGQPGGERRGKGVGGGRGWCLCSGEGSLEGEEDMARGCSQYAGVEARSKGAGGEAERGMLLTSKSDGRALGECGAPGGHAEAVGVGRGAEGAATDLVGGREGTD